MSRTSFLIKKKYNKILNSLMSAEDKIDYTLEKNFCFYCQVRWGTYCNRQIEQW